MLDLTILDTFLVNLAKVHRDKLNGRDVIVARVVMIVPGVLPGSKGPLFYPPEEVAASAKDWDRVPLTAGHPVQNGIPISAKQLGIDRTLGMVQSARYEVSEHDPVGKLVGRAWFDVERTRKLAPAIYNALENGQQIEVSTGLFTQNEPAPSGAMHNGRPYTHIARKYRPDHLAILLNETGACSLSDGCGINTNSATAATLCHCEKCYQEVVNFLLSTAQRQATAVPQCSPVPNPVPVTKGDVMFGFEINRDPRTGALLPLEVQQQNPTVNRGPGVGLPVARIVFGNPLAKLGKEFIANSDNKETETRVVVGS